MFECFSFFFHIFLFVFYAKLGTTNNHGTGLSDVSNTSPVVYVGFKSSGG